MIRALLSKLFGRLVLREARKPVVRVRDNVGFGVFAGAEINPHDPPTVSGRFTAERESQMFEFPRGTGKAGTILKTTPPTFDPHTQWRCPECGEVWDASPMRICGRDEYKIPCAGRSDQWVTCCAVEFEMDRARHAAHLREMGGE